MWIEKVKDGYRFRETYVDTLTGKRRKVAVTMKSKTKAAQKAAYELLQKRINATMANPITHSSLDAHRRFSGV